MSFYPQKRRNKYGNKKVSYGGDNFDSRKEARRYNDLAMLERAGEITDLKKQVVFKLEVNGQLVCKYIADFTYREKGKFICEDVKSAATRKNRAYRIKKKLLEALHGIVIKEY